MKNDEERPVHVGNKGGKTNLERLERKFSKQRPVHIQVVLVRHAAKLGPIPNYHHPPPAAAAAAAPTATIGPQIAIACPPLHSTMHPAAILQVGAGKERRRREPHDGEIGERVALARLRGRHKRGGSGTVGGNAPRRGRVGGVESVIVTVAALRRLDGRQHAGGGGQTCDVEGGSLLVVLAVLVLLFLGFLVGSPAVRTRWPWLPASRYEFKCALGWRGYPAGPV